MNSHPVNIVPNHQFSTNDNMNVNRPNVFTPNREAFTSGAQHFQQMQRFDAGRSEFDRNSNSTFSSVGSSNFTANQANLARIHVGVINRNFNHSGSFNSRGRFFGDRDDHFFGGRDRDDHFFGHRHFRFFVDFGFPFFDYWCWSPYYGSYWPNYYYDGSYDPGYYSPSIYQPGYGAAYYHPRRYIFVSLNGYWPGYNYTRYYYYGTYPYYWYMSDSSTDQPGSYNNYNPYDYSNDVQQPFAYVAAPEKETAADKYFEYGVNAFADGDYDKAVVSFYRAENGASEDMILPFAYIQALFADGNYLKAVQQLRQTLAKQPAGQQWVFFPRGLYTDAQVLTAQINELIGQASADSDLQLLAGYQLLGMQKLDQASEYLNKAKEDKYNEAAAAKLLDLIQNLRTANRVAILNNMSK